MTTPDDLLRVAEIVRTACIAEAGKIIPSGQQGLKQRVKQALLALDLLALLAENNLSMRKGELVTDASQSEAQRTLMTPETSNRQLSNDEIYAALSQLGERIETCGASVELTNAVTLCSDLRRALGNVWNKADYYAAEQVRTALAENNAVSQAHVNAGDGSDAESQAGYKPADTAPNNEGMVRCDKDFVYSRDIFSCELRASHVGPCGFASNNDLITRYPALTAAVPNVASPAHGGELKCQVCGDRMKPTDPYCIECGTPAPTNGPAGGLVEQINAAIEVTEYYSPARMRELLRKAATALQQAEQVRDLAIEGSRKQMVRAEALEDKLQQAEQGREDGERYRWLRENRLGSISFSTYMGWLPQKLSPKEIDEAIDDCRVTRKADR